MTTALKPLAGFLFKMPSEKLSSILRHVRLGPAGLSWGPNPSSSPARGAQIPSGLCSLRGIQLQKTPMQIALFCERLNKLLISLQQMDVVCRPQPLCDWDYLLFPSLIFPLPSDSSYAISPRASIGIACGIAFIYISFGLALLSVFFLGQGNEAKFCPSTRNAAAVPAVWLQPDEAGPNSDL